MKTGRKISGGKYKTARKKKLFEKRGQTRIVNLNDNKTKTIRTMGGNVKTVLLATNVANVMHKGKARKAKIINVIETPANRFLARQNILVKSAVIETDLGKARITNRPSQEGKVEAELIESTK